MNAKTIAQEIVDWYRSHLDPYDCHAVNVRTHLHGPVLSVTHRILNEQDDNDHDEFAAAAETEAVEEEKKSCGSSTMPAQESAAGGVVDKSQWEALAAPPAPAASTNSSTTNEVNQKLYESLGRRSKARMDAFLAGVAIALPGADGAKSKISNKKHQEVSRAKSAPPKVLHHTNKKQVPPQKSAATTSSNSTAKNQNETTTAAAAAAAKPQNPKIVNKSPVLASLNNHGKAILRSVSVEPVAQKQPQIRDQELLIRLELYIRSLYRVNSLDQDCVVAAEPAKAINARVEIIVAAFIATVGCVRSMSPALTKLLSCMTRELMAVEYLGETLVRVIRRLVNEYEHGTSFASLAFLSSPEASAETRLTPMVLKYIQYLQSDWTILERECELERMLTLSLDSNMRRYFKTAEFQSIGHLLEACQGFRNELNNIELPPSDGTVGDGTDSLCNNASAVRQAIRDLQREVITINGQVLPPVMSRQGLIDLLSQSLNSRTLTADSQKRKSDGFVVGHLCKRSGSCPSLISTSRSAENDEDHSSLGDGDDGDDEEKKQLKRKSSLNRRASFHLSTVDILTRRLLIAASRTGTGGDSYFIV